MPAQRSNLTKLALFARPTCSPTRPRVATKGERSEWWQRIRTSDVIQIYYVLDISSISALLRRYARAMSEHVLLSSICFRYCLRELVLAWRHSIALLARDLNSHQPVGIELGLPENSVSKLGTVRSTVGQRVDNDSVFDTVLHNMNYCRIQITY